MRTARHDLIANNVAATLLAGVWSARAMERRLGTLLGRATRKSQKQLVAVIVASVDVKRRPSTADLAQIIIELTAFERAAAHLLRREAPIHMVLNPPAFAPAGHIAKAEVPPLATPGDVARWLGLPVEQLEWFTDERRQHGRTAIPILQHYTYAWRSKAFGPPRLIEAPKPRLKTMQRRILREILDHVPAHGAAFGFVAGRSCRDGAEPHVQSALVARFDIADFFPTTSIGRVYALFRSLGYPHAAARTLTGLCSTSTPASVLARVPRPARQTRDALRAYGEMHLPQGGPTSPALANLVAWRLDVRLSGLARSFGAIYTRYADDLTFSGDHAFAAKANSLAAAVASIVEDEGYRLNERKTRFMAPSGRQLVTGIVVNAHANVGRHSYDALKATLHNCRRHGLQAENRDGHPDFRAHLEGRVGWVESVNPDRGRRLRAILDMIE